MTTNQEGRQAAIRDSTSTVAGVAADWHALFDGASITAGPFNQRLLAWINDQLGTSYSNLLGAMAAYAANAGYSTWASMSTLVLGGASTLLAGETDGLAFDFTDQSARIKDTGTPANAYSSTGKVTSGALVGPGGKLTYTSPANKLVRQSDGYYKYSAHNLCTYSEEIDNVAWGKNGSPTITANADGAAELWTPAASLTQHWIRQPVYTSVAGVTYVYSVRVKPNGYTNVQLFAGSTEAGTTAYCNFVLSGSGSKGTEGATATGSISAVGDGYYDLQLQVAVTGSTATAAFYLCAISSSTAVRNETWTPDGASGYYVTRAHLYQYPAVTDYIKTTTAAVYSLPYEYDTSGTCEGLLVEEVRTNVLLQGADVSTTWTTTNLLAFGSGSTVNAATAPNGETHADLIVPNSTSGTHNLNQAYTSTATTWVLTAYVKAAGYSRVGLREGSVSAAYATFLLSGAGSVLDSGSGGTGGIEAVGNDWYRVWMKYTGTAVSHGYRFYVLDDSYTTGTPSTYNFSGDEASGVYVWGLEAMAGSFPTSPIITYGATATRAADNISIATSAFPYNQPEGAIYAHAVNPIAAPSSQRLVNLSSGGAANRVLDLAIVNSSGPAVQGYNGTTNFTVKSYTASVPFKVAAAYKTADWAIALDGGTVSTLSSATVNTATVLQIGQLGSGANAFCGHVKAISYVPRRKTDAELQTETT